jgi:hypothetical protein
MCYMYHAVKQEKDKREKKELGRPHSRSIVQHYEGCAQMLVPASSLNVDPLYLSLRTNC